MTVYIKVAPINGCLGCVGIQGMVAGELVTNRLCDKLFETAPCYSVYEGADDHWHIWIENTEEAKVKYMAERLTN